MHVRAEKVASAKLAEIAPHVKQLYSRFAIENAAQEEMMVRMDSGGLSAMQAACKWLKDPENTDLWKNWIPPVEFECSAGQHVTENNGKARCADCSPGKKTAVDPLLPTVDPNGWADAKGTPFLLNAS